jgi:hypothetical protein
MGAPYRNDPVRVLLFVGHTLFLFLWSVVLLGGSHWLSVAVGVLVLMVFTQAVIAYQARRALQRNDPIAVAPSGWGSSA